MPIKKRVRRGCNNQFNENFARGCICLQGFFDRFICPLSSNICRRQLLICFQRSPPRWIPPYHRVTITAMSTAPVMSTRCSIRPWIWKAGQKSSIIFFELMNWFDLRSKNTIIIKNKMSKFKAIVNFQVQFRFKFQRNIPQRRFLHLHRHQTLPFRFRLLCRQTTDS